MAKKDNQLVKQSDTATLSNILNEMFYEEKMTLQELRFFVVYLSKINPKNPDKIEVSFSLEEYSDLLGIELNEQKMKAVTRKLMRYVVSVRPKVLEPGIRQHIMNRQLFAKSDLRQRESDGRWMLTFSCHEDIKDHLFDLKSEFTSLEVWNVLNLSNFQDARMYMLLCQYRGIGHRTVDLDELKKMLGINLKAYPEYKEFARTVLKKCQKALKEYTDIEFDFRAIGRPAKSVYFTIRRNKDYKLPKFLEAEEAMVVDALPADDDGQTSLFEDSDIPFDPADPYSLSNTALPQGLTKKEIEHLRELALQHMPYDAIHTLDDKDMWLYHYFREKVTLMHAQRKTVAEKAVYKWLCGAVAGNWK